MANYNKHTCSFKIWAASGKMSEKYSYTSLLVQFVISGMLESIGISSETFDCDLSISCGFKNGSSLVEGCIESMLGMIAGDPTTVGLDSKQLQHSHWSYAFILSGILGE